MDWWIALIAFAAGWLLHSGCRGLLDLLYPRRQDKEFREYLRREYGEDARSG